MVDRRGQETRTVQAKSEILDRAAQKLTLSPLRMGHDFRRRRKAYHRASRSPRSPRNRHHHERQKLQDAATTEIGAERPSTASSTTRFSHALKDRGGHPLGLPQARRRDQRDDKEIAKSVEQSEPVGWVNFRTAKRVNFRPAATSVVVRSEARKMQKPHVRRIRLVHQYISLSRRDTTGGSP
jgi:hypothetical protein